MAAKAAAAAEARRAAQRARTEAVEAKRKADQAQRKQRNNRAQENEEREEEVSSPSSGGGRIAPSFPKLPAFSFGGTKKEKAPGRAVPEAAAYAEDVATPSREPVVKRTVKVGGGRAARLAEFKRMQDEKDAERESRR